MNNKKETTILVLVLFGHGGHCKTIANIVVSMLKDVLLINAICIKLTRFIRYFNVQCYEIDVLFINTICILFTKFTHI